MGAWGWKLFQNDDACDIRDTYKEKLIVSDSDIDAENSIVEEFALDVFPTLWIPLAVTEWKVGRLSATAKENALRGIEEELAELESLWKPQYIDKRRAELHRVSELLKTEMPPRKKLRLPSWAWKCPWSVGSVLQYKLRYLNSDDPLANHYVLLLIQGISETHPGKLSCDYIAVSLYNWNSEQAPSSLDDWNNPPKIVDFVIGDEIRNESHSISLSKADIRNHDVQCIRETPFSSEDYKPSEVCCPLNSMFEHMISRTLNR